MDYYKILSQKFNKLNESEKKSECERLIKSESLTDNLLALNNDAMIEYIKFKNELAILFLKKIDFFCGMQVNFRNKFNIKFGDVIEKIMRAQYELNLSCDVSILSKDHLIYEVSKNKPFLKWLIDNCNLILFNEQLSGTISVPKNKYNKKKDNNSNYTKLDSSINNGKKEFLFPVSFLVHVSTNAPEIFISECAKVCKKQTNINKNISFLNKNITKLEKIFSNNNDNINQLYENIEILYNVLSNPVNDRLTALKNKILILIINKCFWLPEIINKYVKDIIKLFEIMTDQTILYDMIRSINYNILLTIDNLKIIPSKKIGNSHKGNNYSIESDDEPFECEHSEYDLCECYDKYNSSQINGNKKSGISIEDLIYKKDTILHKLIDQYKMTSVSTNEQDIINIAAKTFYVAKFCDNDIIVHLCDQLQMIGLYLNSIECDTFNTIIKKYDLEQISLISMNSIISFDILIEKILNENFEIFMNNVDVIIENLEGTRKYIEENQIFLHTFFDKSYKAFKQDTKFENLYKLSLEMINSGKFEISKVWKQIIGDCEYYNETNILKILNDIPTMKEQLILTLFDGFIEKYESIISKKIIYDMTLSKTNDELVSIFFSTHTEEYHLPKCNLCYEHDIDMTYSCGHVICHSCCNHDFTKNKCPFCKKNSVPIKIYLK